MRRFLPFALIVLLLASANLGCSLTASGDEPGGPAPSYANDEPEECLPGEIYHADENLCFVGEANAEDVFLAIWNNAAVDLSPDLAGNFEDSLDDEVSLIMYDIRNNELANPVEENVPADLEELQQNYELHYWLWDFFSAIIPPDARADLIQFGVSTDGVDGVLASIEQTEQDPDLWLVELDGADAADVQELAATIIHEFGHVLTLGSGQVPPDMDVFNQPENDQIYSEAEAACPTYFTGEGCSNEESYMYLFFERFWAGDLYQEWLAIDQIADEDEFEYAIEEFYAEHEDEFVTDYAATDPAEDIAESWTEFVLSPAPSGDTVAGEKVLFFFEFPELVSLRAQIQARLASRLARLE